MKHGNLAESKITVPGNRGIKLVETIVVQRPAAELYSFWRNLENLGQVTRPPLEVHPISDIECHWELSAPGVGDAIRWDAVIINEEPSRMIAWQSREHAEVPNAGSIRFAPARTGGVEVTIKLEFDPPAGAPGTLATKFNRAEASRQLANALERFKVLMEAGSTR